MIKLVKLWVMEMKRPCYSTISSEGRVLKTLWSQFELLKVDKNILYRQWVDHKGTKLQAVVPSNERRSVLAKYHDNRSSRHLGVSKTVTKFRQINMDLEAFFYICTGCQA